MISASDDYSCRIYDLNQKADGVFINPCWPESKKMSLAGPPFGLRSTDSEGLNFGRCVALLAGGPSGGHLAPVQCAVSLHNCLLSPHFSSYFTDVSSILSDNCDVWGELSRFSTVFNR